MKKQVTMILALLIAGVVTASAQLKVDQYGKASVGSYDPLWNTHLAVNSSTAYTGYSHSICARLYPTNNFNVGICSWANANSVYSSGRSIGIQGVGGDRALNFGVIGAVVGSQDGAGIFGTLTNTNGYGLVNGQYAGYFDGATYVRGLLTVESFTNLSDIRLKEKVTSLRGERIGTLDNVIGMDVIKYKFKEIREMSDTCLTPSSHFDTEQLHYGLSAQDLQKIYPELVYEGQDGYLSINYVELVPILIRAIQELKQELDEVKGGDIDAKNARSDATAISTASATGNVLYQNTPNPFKEKTVIRFSLAPDAQNAAVCIFDMSGKMLKKLPVSATDTNVSINGYELGEGMFLYTLLVNGQEIDTKRMVITK